MKILQLIILLCIPASLLGQHSDISGLVSEYKGAESCVMCHPSGSDVDVKAIAQEVVQSGHFQFKKDIGNNQVYQLDGDNDISNDVVSTGVWGKANRYCGVPGAIPSIAWIGLMQNPNPPFNAANSTYPSGLPGGCARCHVGNGTLKPHQFDDPDAWKTVDCLLCHAETYQLNGVALNNYGSRKPLPDATSPTGMRMPTLSGNDLAVTSSSITDKPKTENCQNCHVWAGGGYTNKRGYDYTGAYGTNPINDIHAENVSCIDCHITKDHKIGMGRIKPACYVNDLKDDPDNAKIDCGYCHSSEGQAFFSDLTVPIPQHNGIPPGHFNKVACQTCHINNNLGLDQKWFDQLVRELDGNGKFKRWKPKGHKVSGQNTLLYKWYNGTVYEKVRPRGSKNDGKIHPFRYMESLVPIDDATGIHVPIKLGLLFNADSTISNLTGMGVTDEASLITKAIMVGAKDAIASLPAVYDALPHDGDGNYTGTYSWDYDIMNFSIDHGTTEKSNAKTCVDCHAEAGGILDWVTLGYSGNPYVITNVDEDSSIPTDFKLGQNYPNPFNPTTTIEYSIAKRGQVSLKIFDAVGNEVETLVELDQAPGHYSLNFDARTLSSGIYFYQLLTDTFQETKKLVLLK